MYGKFFLTPEIRSLLYQKIDRIAILQILGAEKIKNGSDGRIRSTCPIHKGDNPTAFCMLPDTHWECNTHQCDGGRKQDIFSLVQKCKKVNFVEAISFVASLCGVTIDIQSNLRIPKNTIESMRWSSYISSRISREEKKDVVISEDNIRKYIIQRTDHLYNRGFDDKTLNDFEIGTCFDWKGYKESRVVFPIRDPVSRKCIGLQGRCVIGDGSDINPYPRDKKYDNTFDLNKSLFFYNERRGFRVASETGILNIVEGPTNAMWLHQHGLMNSIAPLGVGISFQQIKNLCQGTWKLILMFDPDQAGEGAIKMMVKKYNSLFDLFIGKVPENKDIQMCSPKELYQIYCSPKRVKITNNDKILIS